jgi:TolB-like protein
MLHLVLIPLVAILMSRAAAPFSEPLAAYEHETAATKLVSGVAMTPVRIETVAIGYFDNNSGQAQLDYLRKAFADMLITDLSVARAIQIVERDKLESLLKELRLGETRFIDPATAQKIGKGLSAAYVLTGAYTVVGTQLRIDARLVRTETGEVVLAREIEGEIELFFALEKDLARRLLAALDVELAPAEKRAFETPVTTSLAALEQYGLGLNAQDAGDTTAARRYFDTALEADPGFERARQALAGLTRFMEAIISDTDAAFNSLSVQDPNLTTKLEALTTSLLSSMTGNESQLLRLLTWLASNGVDPELNLYGIKTRMQPAILNGVTYWVAVYGGSLSGKMLVAANTLARRYPGNPSIRTFVSVYGSTLASEVAARDSALKLLDRKALREGMPFGFQEDFRCDTAVFDVFNNSWGVLKRVGDGALAEDYAEAIAKRCLGSRYEEQFRMGIVSYLSMFGRWSGSLRYMSAEQRALVPGSGQGPPDMGPYTRDLERALDAIIRSEKKR